MDVYVNGRRIQLLPDAEIGKGGEANVYDVGGGLVLKRYKERDDPDYQIIPDPDDRQRAQQGAVERIAEQQRKLPAFPHGLPAEVIAPVDLAYDGPGTNRVVGYTMPYLSGKEVLLSLGIRKYREQSGIDGNQVVDVFMKLHNLVQRVHAHNVVVGDFNDLNVLFGLDGQVYLVDADAMQFGSFYCRAFTLRFVDPLLCEPTKLMLTRPHTKESDWYAFSIMLLQSLLYVGPYGGVHRPKQGKQLLHDARVLQRLTLFQPNVIYPRTAISREVLPDELLEYYLRLCEQDQRGEFPLNLFHRLRWTTCTSCGAVHARPRCPSCAAPGEVKETVVQRGTVTKTSVFRTAGQILHATFQGGKLRYLFHENGAFKREDGQQVIPGALAPGLRFRIQGDTTLLAQGQRLLVFEPDESPQQLSTQTVGSLPVFDANQHNRFWIQGGQLMRNGTVGNEYIGNVLSGQTLFWAGSRFGFGFYQAGQLMRAFVFDTRRQGLNDRVPIKAIPGQLIDATCVFSETHAWFMVSTQETGQLINRCYVITAAGEVVAEMQVSQDEDSWLASGIRGHFAAGKMLYASTDDGIVLIEIDNGTLVVGQTFPDTQPFVNADTQLLPGNGGIHAVSSHEIVLLRIKNPNP